MDLKRLTHIVVLADKQNFARAAEQLNLTQPALTRSIQAAESEFGMRLFDRGNLKVTPTPAGAFVLERARQMVFAGRCLKRDVDLYRDRQLGDTAFGMGPFPAATFIPKLLVDVRQSFPHVNVRTVAGNWDFLLQHLREEDIEFFVADISDLPAEPGLHIRPLRPEPGGFYVRPGHPLTAATKVSLKALWQHGVASTRLPSRVRGAIAQQLGLASESDLTLALQCDDVHLIKGVALATDTVLAATRVSVQTELLDGTLVPIEIVGLPPLVNAAGVISLRGRSPSPMADLIVRRLPGIQEKSWEPAH